MTTAPDLRNHAPASAGPIDVATLLRTALSMHQAGRLAEAEPLYRQILAAQPHHFDSLHLLGVIHSQRGEHAAAVRQIDAAIAVNPNIAAAHNNRGGALRALGQRDQALAGYDRAIALAPGYVDALRNRADTLLELGRFDDAVPTYDKAIALTADADLFVKRGHALATLGRLAPAIESYDRAISLAPNDAAAHLGRGIALARLRRYDEAIASYDKTIALDPTNASAFNNRGAALKNLGRFDDALTSCDKAIALDPKLAAAFNNRGLALKELGRLTEALTSYDAAIGLQPDFGDPISNRANALVVLGRFDEAIAGYQHVLAHNPHDATARNNSGMLKLLTGRFEDGWIDYESRWQMDQTAADRPRFAQPQWTGETDIRGKRLLLIPEQGNGDTIMAVRYVRALADRGAHIILVVPAALRTLLAQAEGVDRVDAIVTQGEALPEFDLYCPLLSLPRAFKTTLATIPADVPYLTAPASRVPAWRDRLTALAGPRIGLVWAGNPQHTNDRRRSIELKTLLRLAAGAPASFVSLQKDLRPGDAELLRAHPQVTDLGGELATYDDTAAVISLLDLVISVDTSVAHLAGALGKPLWILLPKAPDWRWLLEREDSPWYPTARLFRQSVADDWSDVIARIGSELGRLRR